MADVVIFGVKDSASLAHFYLKHDSPHRVVAFTVHQEYLPTTATFEGLPAIPFEELTDHFSPDQVSAFAPMTHRKMNRLREGVYNELRAKGYQLISYVSSRATFFPGTPIGDNCFILEGNIIQPFVSIGNNTVMWSGNYIGHHATIGNHVFIAAHVAISGHCRVGDYCFLGLNATVRDQVCLAEGTLVGMGANVRKNTEPWSLYKPDATSASNALSTDLDF
jgi:sugar O-acyltransferase (sialic acid O-acetyltransferase NeuD family)